MKFNIGDRVVLTFSADRLENELFQMVDGLTATVTERYQQDHLPGMDFYEVELEKPIIENGQRIVVISGLLDKELQLTDLAEKKKINPAYLTKNAKAMKDEIKKHAHKDEDDASAYTSHPNGGWKADYDKSGKPYKTKMSQHTKKFKEMFGESAEAINEAEVDKALSNKAEKTGISKGILKKVYNRGLAAWRTGHRPGVSQHQWAMARVNSFATKGKGTWGKADKDLAKKVRAVNEEYDQATDTYSLQMDRYSVDFNYSKKMVMPKEIIDEITRRYPDWREDEEAKLTELGLMQQPRFVMEDIQVQMTKVFYKLEARYDSAGIDGVDASLERVYLMLKITVWDNETDDVAFDEDVELEFKPMKTDISIGEFPITPYSLEIDVPDDLNMEKVTCTFQLGK